MKLKKLDKILFKVIGIFLYENYNTKISIEVYYYTMKKRLSKFTRELLKRRIN